MHKEKLDEGIQLATTERDTALHDLVTAILGDCPVEVHEIAETMNFDGAREALERAQITDVSLQVMQMISDSWESEDD